MKIDDLIQLLNNRLREFQLSRDYARMSGNLEGMNAAEKEIIDLEDTLYQLNLLVDTSKSAAVKEATLLEVITDGSVAVLGEYDITPYATDPLHEEKIMNILSKMGVMDTAEKIDNYIKSKYFSSPVTGEMIMSAAVAYSVDARLMMAIIEQDSSFATAGKAVRTLNPGNVGNDDSGNLRTYDSWQEGVTAVAEWLNRHRGSKTVSEIPDMSTSTPSTATSTPQMIIPTTTITTSTVISQPTTATTTPSAATSTGSGQATSTPETIPAITSTTTATSTSTPPAIDLMPPVITPTSTTTTSTVVSPPSSATTTPEAATSTPEIIPVVTSTTTITSTSAPSAATSTPSISSPSATTTTSTVISTPATATSTPEIAPVVTSTTITATPTE